MNDDERYIRACNGTSEVIKMIMEASEITHKEAVARIEAKLGERTDKFSLRDAQQYLVAAVWVYNELNIRSTK